jgi:hypothetical protein
LKEVEKPSPKDKEVQIRNYGSDLYALDITFRSGRKVIRIGYYTSLIPKY